MLPDILRLLHLKIWPKVARQDSLDRIASNIIEPAEHTGREGEIIGYLIVNEWQGVSISFLQKHVVKNTYHQLLPFFQQK